MQSYIQRKNTPHPDKENSKSEKESSAETRSVGELSGKFKLATWKRKKPARRSLGKFKEETRDGSLPLNGRELVLFSFGGQMGLLHLFYWKFMS